MTKSNGIWLYIKPRGKTYWFWKRYPASVVDVLGEWDRFSLGIKVDRKNEHEAEIKARQFLEIHEAKCQLASIGSNAYDLTKITRLVEIPRECRRRLVSLISVAKPMRDTVDDPFGGIG